MNQILHSSIPIPEDLLNDIMDVIPNPEQWLKMPNEQLGGRTPLDMIGAGDDQSRQVHNLIKAIKHGMMT